MKTRIIGTGRALPEKVFTNDDMAAIVDTSDEWIRGRTGIRQRHLSNSEESAVCLAAKAGENALENSRIDPSAIDLIIVATCSCGGGFPSVACQVQEALGAAEAVAFDLSAACSGFLFALHTADAYIQSGIYKNALIIGAETLSHMIDWSDRSTCVLFGDGAGACVVTADETGLLGYVQKSNGGGGHVLTCSSPSLATPLIPTPLPSHPIAMDGQAVFKFAVKSVPICINQVLEKTNTSVEDVDYFVLHQANERIIQSIAKRLKTDIEKFPMNLEHYGNTSAASIPILLDEMNRNHLLKTGDKIILSGFGAGLTWGAALLEW